jgi:hypothetical protein
MSERLTYDLLEPHIGEELLLSLDDGRQIRLELIAVTALPERSEQTRKVHGIDITIRPDPFSFDLRGPEEPELPQRMYTLRHEALGTIEELFIVPVDRDESGVVYHVVVN